MKKVILLQVLSFVAYSVMAQKPVVIKLWGDRMPYQTLEKGMIKSHVDTAKQLIKITEVSDPLIEVYSPKTKSNRAAIIISPGGGQKFLAWNLEGTEIADWLTKLGYTAVVLQYRVPNNQAGSVADLQRAVKIVRYNADKFKIDTNKIGVIGFSAGGNLSARVATNFKISTKAEDKIDGLSSKPNFALLIYPGSMSTGEDRHLIPEIPVDKDTPPVFVFVASDDPYNIPFSLGVQLRANKIPFEFHVVPGGWHGYGLRKGNPAAEAWPDLAQHWLKEVLKFE